MRQRRGADGHVRVEDHERFLRAELDGPARANRVDQGADAGVGDRMAVVLHRPGRGRLELDRAGEEPGESHVVGQDLAVVAAFDVDGLAALAWAPRT